MLVNMQRTDGAIDLSLSDVFRAVRRRWLWIAVPTLVAFVLSFLWVNLATPLYTGEAKILLENRDSFYTRPGQDREQSAPFDAEAVQSQVQVVMSRDIAREAIRRLSLVGNPEFDPLVSGVGALRKVLITMGVSRNPAERAPEDRILDEYYKRLLVYAAGRSRILAVEFRSQDPELAARAANTISELYLESQEAAKKDTARSASSWLSTNIDTLRKRVAEAEGKVEAFRSRTGLLVGGSDNTTITTQQLGDLSSQLGAARTAQADAQAKARLIRDMIRNGRSFEIPDVANNELIRRLIEQRIGLRAQLALEMRTLLDGHPRIKELNAQLADLESQIRAAAERTVRSLESEAKLAATRVDSLTGILESQKQQVAVANENEVQLRALDREAKTLRDQLETYLSRFREASARDVDNAVPPDARIISRAIEPTIPSFPKKLPIVLVATVGTAVLTLGIIVAGELLGAGARTSVSSAMPQVIRSERIEFSPSLVERAGVTTDPVVSAPVQATGASPDPLNPVIAGIVPPDRLALAMNGGAAQVLTAPRMQVADIRAANAMGAGVTAPLHLGGQAFDEHLLRVLQAAMPRPPALGAARRIMLVTPTDDSGQTSSLSGQVAAKLVELLGKGGRAILVQCPLPEAYLGDDEAATALPGFTDLLCGEATFADVIARHPGGRLHWIASGMGPAEEIAEDPEALEVALSALSHAYDHIVLVVPAMSIERVGGVLAPRADNAIVLIGADVGAPFAHPIAERVRALAPGRTMIASLANPPTRAAGEAA